MALDPEVMKLFPAVGQPKVLPPIIVTMQDGSKVMVPQVALAIASDEIFAKIAAYTAHATAQEVIKMLAEAGVIPEQPAEKEPEPSEKPEEPENGG